MIGNVWELQNVRADDVAEAYTAVRGGSYGGLTVSGGCRTPHAIASGSRGAWVESPGAEVGFRCCATAR
jgi:hypothetical protein